MVLWFLNNPRINLSPFTKDFRVEEQIDESRSHLLPRTRAWYHGSKQTISTHMPEGKVFCVRGNSSFRPLVPRTRAG